MKNARVVKMGVYFLLELLKQVFHFVRSFKKIGPAVINYIVSTSSNLKHLIGQKTDISLDENFSI